MPCPAGTYGNVSGLTTSACSGLCAANHYCVQGSINDSATSCTPHSESPTGSTNITACRCTAGYSGPDGEECVECAPGSYKAVMGHDSCNPCPAGRYGNLTGLTSAICVGECEPNYYCLEGTANSTEQACPLYSESG